MVVLVTGGSKCGKSLIAEKLIMGYDCKRYYIATMIPDGEDAHDAIRRHRQQRRGKGFETIECYRNVGGLKLCPDSAALLECMGNLCANEMFGGNPDRICNDIAVLAARMKLLVIVTNQVGADGMCYSQETMAYIKLLGEVNTYIADMADWVIEAVFGIPVVLKQGGELHF